MVRPPRQQPDNDNVIPLSPFRAELGRARRLRRADALLNERDVDAAVRALPGDELYYVLHELGREDAGPLLAAATPEQLQVVLDFAIWQRDRISPDALADWLEAMAHAPPERIGQWLAGLDVELVALLLRRGARVHNLTQDGEPPDESEGTFWPTPDNLFVLDVVGIKDEDGAVPAEASEQDRVAVIIRLVDSLYRFDKDLARRLLVAASSELDTELEETAYRWQRGRMEDLGFADYYEALEVYRELDLGSVRIGEGKPPGLRSTDAADTSGTGLRVPTALAQRLIDLSGSPFARAAQKLAAGDEIDELRFALVSLTNRVLAADRVTPGDDDAVAATLQRLAATLDLAIERLAPNDDDRAAAALRTIPLSRLFRAGVTMIGKVRRLALALARSGPFGRQGVALAEPADASMLESLTRPRPLYPRLLDQPPTAGERPFQSLTDLARAAAAVERAAAAQVMLHGLGVEPRHIAPDALLLADSGADVAAIDAGLLARTVLVGRLLASDAKAPAIAALDPRDVAAFESQLRRERSGPPTLPAALANRARALLAAVAPAELAAAATTVADRWIAGLAPLEPVLVRKPSARKPPTPKPSARKPPTPKPSARKPPTPKPSARKPPTPKASARKPSARKPPTPKPRAPKSPGRPSKPRAKPAGRMQRTRR